jgi:hypothetical protein
MRAAWHRAPLAGLGLLTAMGLLGSVMAPALAALPDSQSQTRAEDWVARGGGGGRMGGGGGGGGRMGGGGGGRMGGGGAAGGRMGGGGGRAQSGFSQAGAGFNRGDSRPSGGWSNRANIGSGGGPSLNRPANLPASRPGGNQFQGGNRVQGGNRLNNATVNRNWNRVTNVGAINVNAGWARPGWGAARPWTAGWYGGWSSPPWGWWAGRTAVWGVSTLATAAIINDAVNNAIAADSSVIVVPNTSYQLLYSTVQPVGTSGVSFVALVNGSEYQLNADCNQGLINGQQPQTASEAELLNAACQVAFGSA